MFNPCVSGVWYILSYFLHLVRGEGLALVLRGAPLLSQHRLLKRLFFSAVIGADVSRCLWKGKVVDFMLMALIISWHSSSKRIRAHPWHAWRIAFLFRRLLLFLGLCLRHLLAGFRVPLDLINSFMERFPEYWRLGDLDKLTFLARRKPRQYQPQSQVRCISNVILFVESKILSDSIQFCAVVSVPDFPCSEAGFNLSTFAEEAGQGSLPPVLGKWEHPTLQPAESWFPSRFSIWLSLRNTNRKT